MNHTTLANLQGQVSLGWGDWAAVAVFMALVACAAIWARFQQNGSEDFFLAGRSMGWVVVTFSTFATLFSTISFVAVPGEAYNHGLMFSLILVVGAFVYPVGVWLFLRFYFKSKTSTAYEYIESRFNLATRLGSAGAYCIIRMLYGGTVFYAAAKVFESLAGWPPLITIIVVGLFTIAYTTTGGMKAVMITDTIQGVIVILGIGLILFKLLQYADFNITQIYSHASENGRGYETLFQPEFYRMNLFDRFSIWLLLLSAITTPLVTLSADQSVVQRLLASQSYQHAKRAVLVNAFVSVPLIGMLWLIGIGLFYRYSGGAATLPEGVTSDHVMGYFISTNLPAPIPGLITAALLAALMSTIDSTVNCITNVIHSDFLVRLKAIKPNAANEMAVCRVMSVVVGVICVGIAVLLTYGGEGIQSSILEITGIWSSLWLVLLAIFLMGVLIPRVAGWHAAIGLFLGVAISLYLPYALYYAVAVEDRISFVWVGVPGMLVAAVIPIVLSLFWPNRADVKGVTIFSSRQ